MSEFHDNNITVLAPNEVLVFGSNIKGHHGGGAARQAFDDFGAKWGVGEGLEGQSYAFPTLDAYYKRVSNTRLHSSRLKLYECAERHPDKRFLLTKVGCGIASFDEEKMRKLFANAPKNIIKPYGW